jgi:hypothetical protein
LTANTKKLWKNEYFQTILVAIFVIAAVFSFWYGSQAVLHTKTLPFFIVSSGSMCIPYDGACDGWSHPFARTLHLGDLIVIQGANPQTLNANYPNSDIIVFQDPSNPDGVPIVHRITSEILQNGTLYFFTKGDGNPPATWPNNVETYSPDYGWYNPNYYNDHPNIPRGSVPQEFILGRVVMRIPWLGWVTIYTEKLQGWLSEHNLNVGVPIIAILIALLVVVEFIVPLMKRKKKTAETMPAKHHNATAIFQYEISFVKVQLRNRRFNKRPS